MNLPKNALKQQKGIIYQCVAQFLEKNSYCQYLSPFTGLIKNSCLNNFPQDFPPFKYGKKNKHSEYFNTRFCDSHFYV